MKRAVVVTFSIILLFVCVQDASANSYIGLYSDGTHDINSLVVNTSSNFEMIDVWVWIFPDAQGVVCAEYKLLFPENIQPVSTTLNPTNSYVIGSAYGPPGLSICFEDCNYDWFWTAKIQAVVVDMNPQYLVPEQHDDQQTMFVTTCESGYPVEEMHVMNALGVNTCRFPCVVGIEVNPPSRIRAFFDREILVESYDIYSFPINAGSIKIYEKENPSNEIDVLAVSTVADNNLALDITVNGYAESDKEYILETYNLCALGYCGPITPRPVCGNSSLEVHIPGIISTEQSTWGAIKLMNKL